MKFVLKNEGDNTIHRGSLEQEHQASRSCGRGRKGEGVLVRDNVGGGIQGRWCVTLVSQGTPDRLDNGRPHLIVIIECMVCCRHVVQCLEKHMLEGLVSESVPASSQDALVESVGDLWERVVVEAPVWDWKIFGQGMGRRQNKGDG